MEEQRDPRALTFWTAGLVWTSLGWCCCSGEDPRLRFSCSSICWSQAGCAPSTWTTPVMSSGETGSRGLSSASPLPCTSKSIRIKSCKCSLCFYIIACLKAHFWCEGERFPEGINEHRPVNTEIDNFVWFIFTNVKTWEILRSRRTRWKPLNFHCLIIFPA